jgi:Protein of unknown function (DUF4238)
VAKQARQHIAPRSYLEAWAVEGIIDAHIVSTGETKPISTRDAAVRKHFYSVTTLDGTRDVGLEQRLGTFESRAVRVLRALEEQWPLCGETRALVSEFIALQVVRGPLWRSRVREIGQRVPEEHKGKKPHLTSEQWSQIEQANMGEPGILEFMISQLDKVGTLVGSMHWTLVTFKRPLLVTCDHPVSMIDLDVFRGTVDPEPIPRTGLLSALEIRFPVSPTRGLVLSWLDEPDLIRSRAWAGDQENFNYATRAQAEQQWFSRPRA